jgi:hypothetical protein
MPPPPPGLDPNFVFNQVMPVAVLLAVFVGLRWVLRSPVGEAFAERIRAKARGHAGVAVEDPQRVAALEEQVGHLQAQVLELAERLDFAERLLAERRERKLGAGP